MKITNIEDLYKNMLRNLHSSERQALRALPRLADAASNAMLQKTLIKHFEESTRQLDRLEHILDDFTGEAVRGDCEITRGLIRQSEQLIEAETEKEIRDAGIICVAQLIEHHEIAMYGCLRAFANLIDRSRDARLLEASLMEEKEADRFLSVLAIGVINDNAKLRAVPMNGLTHPIQQSAPRGARDFAAQKAQQANAG